MTTQVVTDRAKVGLLGPDRVQAAPLLQPEQDLGHDQGRQPTQADLTSDADRRLRSPPPRLVDPRVPTSGGAPADLVGLAVPAVAVTALPRACSHLTRPVGR